jgi:hypothetical protein
MIEMSLENVTWGRFCTRNSSNAKEIRCNRNMAERVGFVPAVPAPVNNLGQSSIAQIGRNAQNQSIRYKTLTAHSSSVALSAEIFLTCKISLWRLARADLEHDCEPSPLIQKRLRRITRARVDLYERHVAFIVPDC